MGRGNVLTTGGEIRLDFCVLRGIDTDVETGIDTPKQVFSVLWVIEE